ncbi:hypothetical protein [Bathymodiolus septemdierum thioautotrophic gill symbiont]|uniref:HsdR n=1 Tax=endosymbiont of Bathymodiolus septemdierum str. Myojin knoll TaxID=1303921 RepID=A0A0P0USQ0_9GAMM|nr:hypothetical protein [Bathymodiolus septemdierum thioautotrophic gill symbiont]BAS68204.1 conserved hypothetical protein [endosymbiont of Bathymodiolus septemdierum str. Myojin knoll]
MNKDVMLERLVKNGLDFLEKAISELTEQPKYSVIHFHAAVELFLKARLMAEHWTLVISHRQEPDWNKFVSGNFQSVSLDGASDRLTKIVRSGLTKELSVFREITKHRNKMVHFFHEAHSEEENEEQLRDIVKQQLTAWYFLHKLITERWREVFEPWKTGVANIDKELRKSHSFLQVIYDQISSDIKNKKLSGLIFKSCPSCGFDSQEHEDELKEIYNANCLVCGLSEKCIKIECPDCSTEVVFENEGFGQCDNCGKRFEPEDLASEIDDGAAHVAAMDGDDSWDMGNCSDCDGYHTVVRTENDKYVCASCFLVLESLQRCGWCNEPNTGDMEHSHWAGCNHCDGNADWDKDD